MFSRLNPQTPTQIGMAASASIATGLLSAGIAEMLKGPSPEQIRQRQIQEEQARQERARIAREAAEAAERKHRTLLTELKADGGTPQLTLKVENDSGVVLIRDDDKNVRTGWRTAKRGSGRKQRRQSQRLASSKCRASQIVRQCIEVKGISLEARPL